MYEIIALNSDQIIEKLSNQSNSGFSKSIQICVSNNFNIYLHPTSSHYELRSVLGLEDDDIIVEGHCSIIPGGILAIRLKSPRQLESDVFQTSLEGHGVTHDGIVLAILEWYKKSKHV